MAPAAAAWRRVAIQFTEEQYDYLRQRSFSERRSIAAIVRDFVEARRLEEQPQIRLPLERGWQG